MAPKKVKKATKNLEKGKKLEPQKSLTISKFVDKASPKLYENC